MNGYDSEREKNIRPGRKEKQKSYLHVPCIGWIYSQKPRKGYAQVRAPIIIYYLETQQPNYKKRTLYFSFLDEVGSRLRGNVAKGIRASSESNQNSGFNVHGTNTLRYVFAVPKISDGRRRGAEVKSSGRNIYDHYNKVAVAPSFIASARVLRDQGIDGKAAEVLNSARNNEQEKILYRNMVINSCVTGDDGKEMREIIPTCTTNADQIEGNENLEAVASLLGWELHTFLQYVIDQTLANFRGANYLARFKSGITT